MSEVNLKGRQVTVHDMCLRDGMHAKREQMSIEQMVKIATALDEAGVPEMEVGIPVMGAHETALIRAITGSVRRARTMVWARMAEPDLQAALRCDADLVHLAVPVSDLQIARKLQRDRDWVLQAIARFVTQAREAGAQVSVGFEDASRADPAFLAQAAAQLDASQVYAQHSVYKGKAYVSVFLGNFDSYRSAALVIEGLPGALKSNRPLVRTWNKIKQDPLP